MENRQKDLLEVANNQWQANHSDLNKIKKEHEDFNQRMFGSKPTEKKERHIKNNINYRQKEVRNMEQKIDREYDIYKQSKVNAFLNHFRGK